MGWVLVATVVAGVDWWSVWAKQAPVEAVAKTLVPAMLLMVLAVGADTGPAALVAVGLLFALAGDVALLPQVHRFLLGLGFFLVTNAAFVAAFVWDAGRGDGVGGASWAGVAVAAVFGVGAGAVVLGRLRRTDRPDAGQLVPAVGLYVVVQTAMLAAAVATGHPLAIVGAALLASSDMVLAWNRFIDPIRRGRLITHVLYHGALILITIWAV